MEEEVTASLKIITTSVSGDKSAKIAPQKVPLSLSDPKKGHYELASCPRVYEDSWYKFYFYVSNCPPDDIQSIQVLINGVDIGMVSFASTGENLEGWVAFYLNGSDERISFQGQPFLLLFDAVIVSFIINFKNGNSLELFSPVLACLSYNKGDEKNINAMVKELMEFDDYQINKWLFTSDSAKGKRSLIEHALSKSSERSLSSYLELLEEVMVCYKANFNYFRAMGKHRIEKKGVLVSYQSVKSINAKSFEWLMQNADQLGRVNQGGIEYLGEHYLPLKIHSEVNYKSYDIYENQVVIGFLLTVLNNAQQIVKELVESEFNADLYIKRLNDTIKALVNLYRQYNTLFEVSVRSLLTLPRKTKPFQEVKPYTQVFALIIKWFEFGDFTLEQEHLLMPVKALDKLFEIYCLIALLQLLSLNGYKQSAISYYDYGLDNDDKSLPNTFSFYKKGVKVTLYYQPKISSVRFYNELTLFRTTGVNGDFYTPDFVLKFDCEDGDEGYVILDAKFSSRGTIMSHHLQDVMRKYSQETAVAHTVNYPKMVWVLQGRNVNNGDIIYRYANSPLAQQYKAATSFGIYTINSLKNSKQDLWLQIQDAIDWV